MESLGAHSYDVREFQSNFRSKNDWINFLRFNRGCFLPSEEHVTMRFIKDFQEGDKLLLRSGEVVQLNVPYYEEPSVKNIFKQIQEDEEIMKHLNYYSDYTVLPDRKYFYGALGTLHTNYLSQLIKHANRIRYISDNQEEEKEKFFIKDEVYRQLQGSHFFAKSKGKALTMLKLKSKPRLQKKKREYPEISASFSDYKTDIQSKRPPSVYERHYNGPRV